jgi:hypothetical protein
MDLDHGARSAAQQRLVKWFVGAVLSRRYQQSTHEKQARDKVDFTRWIAGDEAEQPQWLSDTHITNLQLADPDGATGKLFRSLMNARGLRDPLTGKSVGVGSEKAASARHHIWPTRWVQTLSGWNDAVDTSNLALNIMYVEESTNGSWLNSDPAVQIQGAIKACGSEAKVRDVYRQHGISDAAFEIMRKPSKTREDYTNFIAEREAFFTGLLGHFGFRRTSTVDGEVLDDEDQ